MSTELLTYQDSTATPKAGFIRDGIAGNADVVFAMIKIIRDSVKYDKGLETLVKQKILIKNNLSSFDKPEIILETVFNYIAANVKYIKDISGNVESIKSARQTLSDGYGDCDDLTNTAASILGVLGFENVMVCVARYFENETSFSHIYCVVNENNKRYVLDNSIPNGNFNDEVKAIDKREIPVFQIVKGLDGFSGIVFNTKHHLQKLSGFAQSVAPYTASFLPLDFFTGRIFETSISFFSEENNPNSFNITATKINHALNNIIRDLMKSHIAYDIAKTNAAKHVAALSVIENLPDKESYEVITNSVKQRLAFIRNFPSFAAKNNIKVIYSNEKLKAAIGLTAIGYGSYQLVKRLRKRKI